MKRRTRPILLVVVLAALSSSAHIGCYSPVPVVIEPPPRDRVVERCHQVIRGQVIERSGQHAVVSFDTPETYYVSSAIEGVQGGGVLEVDREHARIEYRCAVNIRSGRVVQAQHKVIEKPQRPAGWSIEACQDRIEEKVAKEHRRRPVVKFGEAEIHDVSLDREKVRGRAKLKSGKEWQGIRYACTVDLRRGRVEAAHYSQLAKPVPSDAEVVKLCQGAIVGEAKADRGQRTKVTFEKGSTHSISASRQGVSGRAELRSGAEREQIAYRCKVNLHQARVTLAEYRLLERPGGFEERVIQACQDVTREMVAADHGRRAKVKFQTAETFASSKRATGVQGRGILVSGGERDPIQYLCTVNPRKLKVTEARYREIEVPRDQIRRTVDLCHEALRERVESDHGSRVSLAVESSESYFISIAEQGVRGEAAIRKGRRYRDLIRYDCRVNLRRGRVDEVRYRYR